jgi:hypothetical protein
VQPAADGGVAGEMGQDGYPLVEQVTLYPEPELEALLGCSLY